MKPKDLKWPCSWEERRPVLSERVLFVPQHYVGHQDWVFPGWNDPLLFGKEGKVYIEYCSGNGAWILEKAIQNPLDHWVAVEKKFERVRKIWAKLQNLQVPNLIIICGEAVTFSRYYLPEHSVDGIYVNFPDPWPKGRHAKNRLLQEPFVGELSRIVKKKGKSILVTDDPPYSEQMIAEMKKGCGWKADFPDPCYVTEWPDYGTSYFDELWREKGRAIRYMQFSKC